MKYKYLLSIIIIILSFYVTDNILLYIDNQKPIMKEILNVQEKYNTQSVNATIEDIYIIPGIKGKTINNKKSLNNMELYGYFNESFLIYDYIEPEDSINSHKDKIINKGNSNKRGISLIIDNNKTIDEYLVNQKIKHNYLSTINQEFNEYTEYLNAYYDINDFSDLESILKKSNHKNNICIIGYNNKEECIKRQYYLVEPTINTKYEYKIYNKINSGYIILINSNYELKEIKLLLQEITKQDLKIMFLSNLISENI